VCPPNSLWGRWRRRWWDNGLNGYDINDEHDRNNKHHRIDG
jgi:hypothetical protein